MEEVKVKSLGKALEVLNFFSEMPYEYGVTEIANKMDCPKSTVHNILSTYASYGILQYSERTRTYKLGYKVLELGNIFQGNDAFVTIMRPFMEEVSAKTNECVYLGKISDTNVLYLDVIYPTGSIFGNVIGLKAPLYCTGIGKAMLFGKNPDVIDEYLPTNLKAFTEYTITDKEALLKNLRESKERGYAIDDMEHEFGVKCVAVPILGATGELVGGLSISGPSLRFSDDKIRCKAAILQDIANRVKRYL